MGSKINFISVHAVNDAGNIEQYFINTEHVLLVRTEDDTIIIKLTNGEIIKINNIPIHLFMDKFYR